MKSAFLAVVDVGTVQERIHFNQDWGKFFIYRQTHPNAIGTVVVTNHHFAGIIRQANHIALAFENVVVRCTVVGHGQRLVACVGKVNNLAIVHLTNQLISGIDVFVDVGAVGPPSPHSVRVIGVGPGHTTARWDFMIPYLSQGIGLDYVIFRIPDKQRIANVVVLDGLSGVLRQQIASVAVSLHRFR